MITRRISKEAESSIFQWVSKLLTTRYVCHTVGALVIIVRLVSLRTCDSDLSTWSGWVRTADRSERQLSSSPCPGRRTTAFGRRRSSAVVGVGDISSFFLGALASSRSLPTSDLRRSGARVLQTSERNVCNARVPVAMFHLPSFS